MAEIIILNRHHNHGMSDRPIFINIMRYRSVLGNQFNLDELHSREIVVSQYHEWLRNKYKERGEVFKALVRLARMYKQGVNIFLECCCAPRACHGDVIKSAIIGIAKLL